jgi:hypothetical protein
MGAVAMDRALLRHQVMRKVDKRRADANPSSGDPEFALRNG